MTAPVLAFTRIADGAPCAWVVADPQEKLAWRGRLPGASVYDRAAQALRALQADGAAAIDLLPLALPTSWMVNAKATSRAMQSWLRPPAEDAWAVLLELIGGELGPADWLALTDMKRRDVTAAVRVLADGENGKTIAAVSKVLALLRPQIVPLMDDAALWFVLDCVPEPQTADAPAASPDAFIPMLDWFAEQVSLHEAALVAMAARHEEAVLDGAQVLDRLLWIESWGRRLMV